MVLHVVCPGECFLFALTKCAFFCFWVELWTSLDFFVGDWGGCLCVLNPGCVSFTRLRNFSTIISSKVFHTFPSLLFWVSCNANVRTFGIVPVAPFTYPFLFILFSFYYSVWKLYVMLSYKLLINSSEYSNLLLIL